MAPLLTNTLVNVCFNRYMIDKKFLQNFQPVIEIHTVYRIYLILSTLLNLIITLLITFYNYFCFILCLFLCSLALLKERYVDNVLSLLKIHFPITWFNLF